MVEHYVNDSRKHPAYGYELHELLSGFRLLLFVGGSLKDLALRSCSLAVIVVQFLKLKLQNDSRIYNRSHIFFGLITIFYGSIYGGYHCCPYWD